MIEYTDSLDGIRPDMLGGFFKGWCRGVSPEEHLKLLRGSDHVVLALADANREATASRVVGFVTAISDGVLCAYIPLLEVLSDYRGQGIGTELVKRLLCQVNGLYMVDVMCDPDLQPFYARHGMHPSAGMITRNYGMTGSASSSAKISPTTPGPVCAPSTGAI